MRKLPVLMLAAMIALMGSIVSRPAIAQTAQATSVAAELKSKVDTKSAKVGDTVTAKTMADVTVGTMKVPKGSTLMGKVSQVQSKSAGAGTATLLIVFDQVQPGKKAAPMAIHGVLVAVAPRPSMSDAGPSTSALPMASTRSVGAFDAQTGASDSGNSGMGSLPMGSSMHGVTLAAANDKTSGVLTSDKDIKLDGGTRIGVQLASK